MFYTFRSKAIYTLPIAILSGCAIIAENTTVLSDEKLLSETAGVLGYSSRELVLVSRRTEGTNTYTSLKSHDGREFNCIVSGGNLLTAGMINPPMCAKKGEPINTNPFLR